MAFYHHFAINSIQIHFPFFLFKNGRKGSLFSVQFDGEPGEIAKDACAEFCKNQKLALEQLKVCN